ncbi:MAG: hypothetical protein AB7O57_05525 [Hyphomicrobiaceae bacterium]
MNAPEQSPKLPIIETLVAAWGSVPRNIGLAFRLYWPWIAVVVLCLLAWGAGVIVNSGFSQPSPALVGGAAWVPTIVMVIAMLLAGPAVFVGWHRGIQTGQRPAQPILIDGAVWGYIGYSILIGLALLLSMGLVVLLVTVTAGITTGLGDGPMSLERLAALRPFLPLAILPYYLLLSRFSLVLPAVAVQQPMSLADSFRRTRGNTWRLTIGAGLVYLPVVIISSVSEVVGVAFPGAVGLIVALSAALAIAWLFCLHAALSFGTFALQKLAPQAA